MSLIGVHCFVELSIPSFDTDSCMSVNVLSSPVGSNAVTNYVDSAESMRKSPQRAMAIALPLVIWLAIFGSYASGNRSAEK